LFQVCAEFFVVDFRAVERRRRREDAGQRRNSRHPQARVGGKQPERFVETVVPRRIGRELGRAQERKRGDLAAAGQELDGGDGVVANSQVAIAVVG